MMTAKDTLYKSPIPIRNFNAAKQAEFFASLNQLRFNGKLILTTTKGTQWIFYFYLGRLVYASGGVHPVRRWRRNLAEHCREILAKFQHIQNDISAIASTDSTMPWDYTLLLHWLSEQKINREQATNIVCHTVVEVLFDVTQAMEVTCQIKADSAIDNTIVLLEPELIVKEAEKLWQAWQNAKIADRTPDLAPVIKQPEQLQKRTTPQVYQNLNQLLDGQQTLRDLSIRMKRDVLTVTRSLIPYMQQGLVQLTEIADIPSPVPQQSAIDIPKERGATPQKQNLIACVDDSVLTCQTMEKIVTSAGYQFIGVTDSLRAIAMLLSRKPDVIFLDLVMPNTSGYEICSQLRKLSVFRNTPIIILTGNDGIIDRVRAKMVGSTDFISKPVEAETVLNTIRKQIEQQLETSTGLD
jgi:two-component system, chemotaxis family, response regulator PixG